MGGSTFSLPQPTGLSHWSATCVQPPITDSPPLLFPSVSLAQCSTSCSGLCCVPHPDQLRESLLSAGGHLSHDSPSKRPFSLSLSLSLSLSDSNPQRGSDALPSPAMEPHHYVEVQADLVVSSSEEALRDNVSTGNYMREAAAEMIGTFFIVFAGSAGGILTGYGQLSTSICGGLAVVLMIFATGHISKAHLNPAVTLGFAMAGAFPWKQVIPYILAQIIGSLLASASLQVIVHDATLFSTAINQPLQYSSASFVMEFVATYFLMFINMKVACNLGQVGAFGGAFMVGMTVALLGIYAGPLCGGLSMNPARSIGPAIVALNLKSLYIYVIGPIFGAIVSGVTYGVICPRDANTNLKSRQSLFTNPFTLSKSCFNVPT